MEIIDKQELKAISLCVFPTGSRIICNPPVLDTDEDWYILVENLDEFKKAAQNIGYEETTKVDEYGHQSDFITFRRDIINLIVTENIEFFQAGALATSACRLKNCLEKKDRIYVFEYFRTYSANILHCVKNWESYYDRHKARHKQKQNLANSAAQFQQYQNAAIRSMLANQLNTLTGLAGTITGRLT